MLLEKSFLSDVYHSSNLTISTILQSANIFQINIVLKVIHFVASGDIPIHSKVIEDLEKSRKAGFLHKNFKNKTVVKKLLSQKREEKLAILKKIQNFLPGLIESLFVPPPNSH